MESDVVSKLGLQANAVRKDSFVGSKEWIGSMEVGWLLQWLFPVSPAMLPSAERALPHRAAFLAGN